MAGCKAVCFALLLMIGSSHLVLGQVLIIVPETTSVEFGSTVFMTCVVDSDVGNDVTFSWSLNGNTIDDTNPAANDVMISKMNVSQNGMTFEVSTLHVCSVGIDDIGEYSCTVANSTGSIDTAAWNITIANIEEAELLIVSDSINVTRFGDTTVMTCAASGYPTPTIAFQKDGISISDDGSKFMLEGDQVTIDEAKGLNFTVSTLLVCNVDMNAIGSYTCTASNGVGSPHAMSWSISAEPRPPEIVTAPTDHFVEYISTVNMTCIVNGYPIPVVTFGIRVDGETVGIVDMNDIYAITEESFIDPESRMVYRQSVLTVFNIGDDQLGTYSCIATNEHGSSSNSWNITFPRDPSQPELIMVPDKVHTVEYGASLQMMCVYDAYPQPEIVVSKNGTPIIVDSVSKNVEIFHDMTLVNGTYFDSARLEILSIGIDDVGEYTCTASNVLGNQSYSWNVVFVRDLEPAQLLIVTSNNTFVDHGSTIILSCVAYGYPVPDITWLKDDTILTTSAPDGLNISDEILTEEGFEVMKKSFLKICGLSGKDSGVYTCQAKNPLATEMFDLKLDVLPATTKAATTTEKADVKKDQAAAGVIGGSVGGVLAAAVIVCIVVVIVIIAIVVLLKRKAPSGHSKLPGSQEGPSFNNPVYAETDTKLEEKTDLSFSNPAVLEEGFGSMD